MSSVVTHKLWHSQFIHGVHKRVGEARKPDEIITIDELHAINKILKVEWKSAKTPD